MKTHILCSSILLIINQSIFALTMLSDDQLSENRGQALFYTKYDAPSGSGNGSNTKDFGFYRLGWNANLELNVNVKKLQLGCGGVNGANGCDIDIDHVAISGIPVAGQSAATTSAVLTNPYIQFAFKNPDNPYTRELVGYRLASEKVNGLLQLGSQSDSDSASDSKNGINSLSGYLKIKGTTGTAYTVANTFNEVVTGKLKGYMCVAYVNNNGCGLFNTTGISLTGDFRSTVSSNNQTSAGVNIPLPSIRADFVVPGFEVMGNRMTFISTQAYTALNNVPLLGTIANVYSRADALGLNTNIPVNNPVKLDAKLNNVNLTIKFKESLAMIHAIPLTGNGLSFSVQKQDVYWPDSLAAAQRGWWLGATNEVDLGDLSPTDQIDASELYPRIGQLVSKNFNDNPLYIGYVTAAQALTGQLLAPPPFALDMNTYTNGAEGSQFGPVVKSIEDPKLLTQRTISNCYGSLKYC